MDNIRIDSCIDGKSASFVTSSVANAAIHLLWSIQNVDEKAQNLGARLEDVLELSWDREPRVDAAAQKVVAFGAPNQLALIHQAVIGFMEKRNFAQGEIDDTWSFEKEDPRLVKSFLLRTPGGSFNWPNAKIRMIICTVLEAFDIKDQPSLLLGTSLPLTAVIEAIELYERAAVPITFAEFIGEAIGCWQRSIRSTFLADYFRDLCQTFAECVAIHQHIAHRPSA